MSFFSQRAASELDWDNHPDDEGNYMDTICDKCGRSVSVDDALDGWDEWDGATLCPDCAAEIAVQEAEEKVDAQE